MPLSQAENINSHFFDGYYKEIWRGLIPEGLTKAEVDFLIERANLKSAANVLDLMCGYGRHALAFANKGIRVTAVDILPDYINEVKSKAESEKLPVTAVLGDVLNYEPTEMFDLVICLGNNLSFFDREETETLFSIIARHTKPKGLFIANSWTMAEIVYKNFTPRTWSEVSGIKYLADSRMLFNPTRIEIDLTMIADNGQQENKKAVDYVYSLNEVQHALTESGFRLIETWAIPGKKKFTFGEPRIYMVAEKR